MIGNGFVGGNKLPNFNSEESVSLYKRAIQKMSLPIDALQTYGVVDENGKISGGFNNVRYRAKAYQFGFERALTLKGDLIDFGTYHGLFPFICHQNNQIYKLGKKHHLFDTWGGEGWELHDDPDLNTAKSKGEEYRYSKDIYQKVKRLFSEIKGVKLHRGLLPESYERVEKEIKSISFACVDVNAGSNLELELIELIWDKMEAGAMLYIDDYGFSAYPRLTELVTEFANFVNQPIFEIPTGSAYIIK